MSEPNGPVRPESSPSQDAPQDQVVPADPAMPRRLANGSGSPLARTRERWEYCVIHVNEESSPKPSATEASQKLGGSLSPDFIENQFPDQYRKQRSPHPAEQLGHFLNKMGEKGWMLTNITSVGSLQMYIFRRPKLNSSDS